jgi:phytoene synthase
VVTPGADAAYAACLQLARSHYENFPVASRLLPSSARRYVAAIYAFARMADDFADEGVRPADERLALLGDWQARLDAAAEGRVEPDGGMMGDAVFVALRETFRALGPELHEPLSDLLSAFRQDVTTTRYARWEDLLDYCRRSANPVGRLVLLVTRHRDPNLARLSDHVCTALQLTNFWQDLAIDWRRGRLYVPTELVAAHGARVDDLGHAWTPAWRATMAEAGSRTQALFDRGRPVADLVRGRLRYELRATWIGGTRILDRVRERDYDVFTHRPSLSRRDVPGLLWRSVTWRAGEFS